MTQIVNFNEPVFLNGFSKLERHLKKQHTKLGLEQLTNRLDTIFLEWATANNYHMETQDNAIIFTHKSIIS